MSGTGGSGELGDRYDHADQDEQDDRRLHPDPRGRHRLTAYDGAGYSALWNSAAAVNSMIFKSRPNDQWAM
jgi:hypothetical protein